MPGGHDDERLHRGEGELIDAIEADVAPEIQEVIFAPMSNADMAARAAAVRAQRGQGEQEEETENAGQSRKQFTGSIPPPPPPPNSKTLTTADEPDGDPNSGLPPGDDEDGEQAIHFKLAAPPPTRLPTSGASSWLAPRSDDRD